jgi:LPXTG-motif cell wall-anchored protein
VDIVNYPTNVELPGTGGIGTPIYMLCGLILVLGPLVYGFSLRRRYGRRSKN